MSRVNAIEIGFLYRSYLRCCNPRFGIFTAIHLGIGRFGGALARGSGCWNRHVPPRAGAGSSTLASGGLRGGSLAGYLGQGYWVQASIALFGPRSIGKRLGGIIVDLGGVPDPLFLGRSNPLAMKFERRGPSTAFSWLTHPLPLLFRENGRSGLFRAFPGASFALLQNYSWAYPVLGKIPAPLWVIVFGASRRVWAGPGFFGGDWCGQ